MSMIHRGLAWSFALLFCFSVIAEDKEERIVPREGLILARRDQPEGDQPRRMSMSTRSIDIISRRLVEGSLSEFRPQAGEPLEGEDNWIWKRVELDENGSAKEQGMYMFTTFESDRERVMILHPAAYSEAYFNGQPRGSDVYGKSFIHVPVLMRKGENRLLLRPGRGRNGIKIEMYAPPAATFLLEADKTLPDLVADRMVDTWGAIVVVNATQQVARGLSIVTTGSALTTTVTPVPAIPPLSARKVGFRLRGRAPGLVADMECAAKLRSSGGDIVHSIALNLKVKLADQPHNITFVSEIDGSVQYYALRPAAPLSPGDPPPAIVLTCHGAGVGAQGQAGSYSTKSWFHIVAPTNRRPFGYDWEDFGREDAMEVLGLAQASLPYDPYRVYVSGHSMGGHGAWHLGVTFPDRFAAVGPSAGWLSRESYVSRGRGGDDEKSPIETLLLRERKQGDTLALSANLKHHGVYILHGADDDNVPVSQARRMAEALEKFHNDWRLHEEPGKRHWWGNEYNDGGTACLDWPFMFDMFARHALPPSQTVREIEFLTANPGVSSSSHWVGIEGQLRHHDISKVNIHVWPGKRAFRATTDNVAVLRLDVRHLRARQPVSVELDGQTLADIPYPDRADALWFGRQNDEWRAIAKPPLSHKGPHRYGSVKDELKHRFLMVYASQGTEEENAASFQKARLDAETFWYRGNGSVDIMADSDFDAAQYPDRTVVLYGNADTNGAWEVLLGDSPVQARRGHARVGARSFEGDDLTLLFLRPRPDSDIASVVVVAGSGPAGMRAATPLTPFNPFTRYPDCTIWRAAQEENPRSTTVAAGYFGLDWSVERGEFAFEDQERKTKVGE